MKQLLISEKQSRYTSAQSLVCYLHWRKRDTGIKVRLDEQSNTINSVDANLLNHLETNVKVEGVI